MIADAWDVLGETVTQVGILIGIALTARYAHRAQKVAQSTNDAVNNVDKDGGELKLIDQVRSHGRQLARHNEYHEWTAGLLSAVAEQVGVDVPPLPEFDDQEAA